MPLEKVNLTEKLVIDTFWKNAHKLYVLAVYMASDIVGHEFWAQLCESERRFVDDTFQKAVRNGELPLGLVTTDDDGFTVYIRKT